MKGLHSNKPRSGGFIPPRRAIKALLRVLSINIINLPVRSGKVYTPIELNKDDLNFLSLGKDMDINMAKGKTYIGRKLN